MSEINLWRKVDLDEDLACHDMILTIENHARKKMAVKGVFWAFLGLQWGPRNPRCIIDGPLRLVSQSYG